jgi:iron-sulfur cluster repair protein YtfE (RIC family)
MVSEARQRLSDDHRAVNEVLKQLLTALHNKDVETSYFKLDLLWARLAVHIRAEHLHLFPVVIDRLTGSISHAVAPDLTKAQSIVNKLRADHDFFMRKLASAIRILRELSRLVDSADDGQASFTSVYDAVLEVEKRLANHNEIEEHRIYRWASTILKEPEQIELLRRINAELEKRPSRFSVEAWSIDL